MLDSTRPKGTEHKQQGEPELAPTYIYEVLLPRRATRGTDLQQFIVARLRFFTWAKRAELRAALAQRLRLTQELLAAIAHNLGRSEQLYRQVMTDRQRLLALLQLLEDENARLHRELQRHREGHEEGT